MTSIDNVSIKENEKVSEINVINDNFSNKNHNNEQANITFNKQNESINSFGNQEKKVDENDKLLEKNIHSTISSKLNENEPNPNLTNENIDSKQLKVFDSISLGSIKMNPTNYNKPFENNVESLNLKNNNEDIDKEYIEANRKINNENQENQNNKDNNNIIDVNLNNLTYKTENLGRNPNNEKPIEDNLQGNKFKSLNLNNQRDISMIDKQEQDNITRQISQNLNSNSKQNLLTNEKEILKNSENFHFDSKSNNEKSENNAINSKNINNNNEDNVRNINISENYNINQNKIDQSTNQDNYNSNIPDNNNLQKIHNIQDSIERISKDNRNLQNKFEEKLDTIREKRKLYMNDINDFNNLLTENNAYDDNHILSRDFFNPLTTESCIEKSNIISSFNNLKSSKKVSIFTNPKFINIINDLDKVKNQKNNENLNIIKNQISNKINKADEENKYSRHKKTNSNSNNNYIIMNKPNNTLKEIYKIMSYDLQTNPNNKDKFSNIKLSVKDKFTNYQNQVIHKNVQQSNVVSKSYLTPITKSKKNSNFNEAVNKYCKLEESNNIIINKLKITNDTRNFQNIKQSNNSRNISCNLYQNKESKKFIIDETLKAKKNLSEVKFYKNMVYEKTKLNNVSSLEKFVSKTNIDNNFMKKRSENNYTTIKLKEKPKEPQIILKIKDEKEKSFNPLKTTTNFISKISVKDNMFSENYNRLHFNNNMASSFKIQLSKEKDLNFNNQIKTSYSNLNLLSNSKPDDKVKVKFDEKLFDKNAQRIKLCKMEIDSNKKKFFELISK